MLQTDQRLNHRERDRERERETPASPRQTAVLSALRCVVLRPVALRYIEREILALHRHTVVLSTQTLLCCELCCVELLCFTELC